MKFINVLDPSVIAEFACEQYLKQFQKSLSHMTVVSRTQAAFILLYWVGKKRVWYTYVKNSVHCITAVRVIVDCC